MDKTQTTQIQIQIMAMAQKNLSEMLSHMPKPALIHAVTDTSSDKSAAGQEPPMTEPNSAERQKNVLPKKTLDSFESGEQVRDVAMGKAYEKLVLEGKKTDDAGQNEKVLSLLNEVQNAVSNPGYSPTSTSASVAAEFDESLPVKPVDEEEPEKEGSDDSEDEDGEEGENSKEEFVSLKQTDPGYFKSILIKI